MAATTYQPRIKIPTRADAIAMADQIAAAMKSAGFAKIHVEERDFKPPAVCVIGVRAECKNYYPRHSRSYHGAGAPDL